MKLLDVPVSNYRVRDVEQLPKSENKLGIVELFAGAGGLAQGFTQTGRYELISLTDIDHNAQTTFKENYPQKEIEYICEDVKKIKAKHLIKNAKGREVVGVLGGPPCQGFSLAGLKKSDDERN